MLYPYKLSYIATSYMAGYNKMKHKLIFDAAAEGVEEETVGMCANGPLLEGRSTNGIYLAI